MNRIKWLISAFFLIISPTIVHAWTEDILLHFQPYITIQEEYNSNIDLTPNRYKRDDFITTISPGLRFSTSPRSPVTGEFRRTPTAEEKYGVDLDFRAGFHFYAKENEENYTSLNGTLNAWYAFTPKLSFKVREYLIRSNDIYEYDYSPTAIPGQTLTSRTITRVPYIRNVVEPSLQYQYGKDSFLAFNYSNNIYRIDSRLNEDSMGNSFNPSITHWFDIRNGVSFEYVLILGDFQRSPDLVGQMARGRYTYRFNPNTSIFAEYTQQWRNFDAPGNDYVIYRPSTGIEHAFTPTLSLRIQGGYYWANPKIGSTVDGFFGNVLLSQQGEKTTYSLAFQGGYTENFFTAENEGFTQTYRAIGRISHQLLQKMIVGISASYEWIQYYRNTMNISLIGREKQKDNIWTIGGNASYELFRWLTLALEVSYRENRSNIDSADYSEYRGIFKITATF